MKRQIPKLKAVSLLVCTAIFFWAAFVAASSQGPQTPPTLVAHTDKQLEHSKLFQSYGVKGRKLTEGQGDQGVFGEGHVPLFSALPPRLDVFRKMACESDAVILGKVVAQTSLLTPDETFIFTDAEMLVLEVLKDNPGSPLSAAGQKVTVTRPGGAMQLNGRKLRAVLAEFRDFSTGGQYLLFLKFLPTSQDYEAFGRRSFELRDGMIFNLTREVLWDGQQSHKQDETAALADAHAAVANPCN